MKIIKKPKLKALTCETCHCVFQPKPKDINSVEEFGLVRNSVKCPVCHNVKRVEFER